MTGRFLNDSAVAQAWDQNAERWTQDVRAGFDLYRELYTLPAFLDFMPSIADKDVIDLGCGEGTNTRHFARLGGHITGIDLSEKMIAYAQAQEAADPLGITYQIGSFSDLSAYGDERFDIALSTMALMDGPDFPAAMQAAYRVLTPGGVLCFSVLHPCFITPAIKWLIEEDGFHSGLRIGRYFDQSPFVERWRFSKRPDPDQVLPFSVPRFPRTLSDYINAVSDAGFQTIRVAEPRPDESLSAQHAWLKRWRDHAPLVLFVSAIEP
ncbi:class I SAM-dependent methyltransferase [Microvirga sp. VF16]|uniref:class I SAM-dependent methyltransferase n=1 Tax=Microvirga sp. VF16 TaxID=2807101 RepID=UPI00193EB0BC|nr:class I SAM-dependent methyltransferase [Microvirga sp. VF16]QRM36136.1 methyltransferase domain-containing protein [Microvirga sp. VF16]